MVLTNNFENSVVVGAQNAVDIDFTHGAIGTGTTEETQSDTDLEAEVFRDSRQQVDQSAVSGGEGTATASLFVNSTEANGNQITELGFFDAASGGELQQRDTFEAIEKTNDIELFFDVEVSITVSQDA